MFISVRRYQQGAGTAQELAKAVEDGFAPIVSEIDGCRSYHVVDAGDSTILSISIFDDRSGAEESDSKAAEWVPDGLAAFEPSDVQITEGEVLLSK